MTTSKILDANITTGKITSGGNEKVLVTDVSGTVEWIDKTGFGAVADMITIEGAGTTASPFEVKDLGIITAKIADLNVTTGKLAADAVTNAQLADNAVQTENILNESILSADIKNGEVKTIDIADANVTTAKIAPSGTNNQVLATNGSGVVSWEDKIADGTVANNTMRWSGTAWVETTSLTNNNTNTEVTGELAITGKTTTNGALAVKSTLTDTNDSSGNTGQLLASTAIGVDWVDAPSGLGVWTSTQAYDLGDLVLNNDKLYQANANIAMGAPFFIGAAGWKEISKSIITWVNLTNFGSYAINDLVSYNGDIYINKTGINSNATPNTDVLNWTLFSVKIISDADGNTSIEVEKTPNDDAIVFTTAGTERATIDDTGVFTVAGDFRVNGTNDRLIFTRSATNRVGINNANPEEALHVSGNIGISGIVRNTSDGRLKESIATLDNSLEKLLSLRGVSYYWKDKTVSEDLQIGVIAQEIETVFPELVSDGYEYKSVNYTGLIPILLEALKEQQVQLEAKEAAIITLKARLARIEEALGME